MISIDNYKVYKEPNKTIAESNILRVDLFNRTSLEDVEEIKDLDYQIHDNHVNWCGPSIERKTLYLTINQMVN